MSHRTADDSTGWAARRDALYDALSRREVMAALTVLPTILLFAFVTFLPIVWAVYAGFYEVPTFSPDWVWVGLGNYVELLGDEEFWAAIRRGVVFAGGSVALQLVVGTGVALLVNQQLRFSSVVRAIVMLPYLIPTAVVGFIALWMGNSQWGIVNQLLVNSGLIEAPIGWYGSPDLVMPALVVTNSWKFTFFVTIMVLARLQSIPDEYYEVAEMCGAGVYQRFRDVTLPNLKGIIFIVLLLRGVWMFNKFDIIWVLTEGGPADRTTTAPVFAYETAFQDTALGLAAAISTTLFVLLVVVAIVYFVVLEPEDEVRVE